MRRTCIWMMILIMTVLALAGCTGYSDSKRTPMGGFEVVISDSGKKCFVVSYSWDGDPDNNVIDVPDDFSDETKIVSLGGFTGTGVPNPFSIEGPDDLHVWKQEDISAYDVPTTVKDMVFTLRIGKNIKEVYQNFYSYNAVTPYSYIGVKQQDGSIVFYRILLNVECSADNQYLYSDNGKLYSRKDNSVEQLPYPGGS